MPPTPDFGSRSVTCSNFHRNLTTTKLDGHLPPISMKGPVRLFVAPWKSHGRAVHTLLPGTALDPQSQWCREYASEAQHRLHPGTSRRGLLKLQKVTETGRKHSLQMTLIWAGKAWSGRIVRQTASIIFMKHDSHDCGLRVFPRDVTPSCFPETSEKPLCAGGQ